MAGRLPCAAFLPLVQEERCRCWFPCRHKSFRVLSDNRFAQSLDIPRIVMLAPICTTITAITNLKEDYDTVQCDRPTSTSRASPAASPRVR